MCDSRFGRRRHRANERALSLVGWFNACLRDGRWLVADAMTDAGEAINGTAESALFLAAGMSCAVGPVQASRAIRRTERPRVYRFSPDDPVPVRRDGNRRPDRNGRVLETRRRPEQGCEQVIRWIDEQRSVAIAGGDGIRGVILSRA
jgi:hypothetical protein